MTRHEADRLCLDIYENWLAPHTCDQLSAALGSAPLLTAAGRPSQRRRKQIFGVPELPYYRIVYRGKTIDTPIRPWMEIPVLAEIAASLSRETGQTYHVCVVQYYNNGGVGILPHRDKEMAPGTIIASISLGATREMRFERHGCAPVSVPLTQGTLCLIQPPTNDHWLHSIPKDATTGWRMSLVFRNCANMIPKVAGVSTEKGL
jgi:alkylated DNA repair dioxygenase AlkB